MRLLTSLNAYSRVFASVCLPVLGLTLILGATPARAQEVANVSGLLKNKQNQLVNGAQITMIPLPDTTQQFTMTTDNYSFVQMNLPLFDSNDTGVLEREALTGILNNKGNARVKLGGDVLEFEANVGLASKEPSATIYNMLGQKVAEIGMTGNGDTGLRRGVWDKTNAHGAPVAAGMYFFLMGETVLKVPVAGGGQPAGYLWNAKASRTMRAEAGSQEGLFKSLGANPTDYLFQLRPISGGHRFVPLDTVITLNPGNNYPVVYVTDEPIPERPSDADYVFVIRNVSRNTDGTRDLLGGATVRLTNLTTSAQQQLTTNGEGTVIFDDVVSGAWYEVAMGGLTSHFAKKDTIWVPRTQSMQDTIRNVPYTLVPKNIPVPGAPGTTVPVTIAQIEESDFMLPIEEAMGRPVRLYIGSMSASDQIEFRDRLNYWDAQFYDNGAGPWQIVDQPINTAGRELHYDPYTNYYEGELGWNVQRGTDHVLAQNTIVLGDEQGAHHTGTIYISFDTEAFAKEMYGRRAGNGDVYSRTSFMNNDAATPTLLDRAMYKLLQDQHSARWGDQVEQRRLDNLYENMN